MAVTAPLSSLPLAMQGALVADATQSLGVLRTESALPNFNMDLLVAAAGGLSTGLPNPNGSTGCSPILRALVYMTGLPFALVRELGFDGQPYGHEGGNAIDITGPTIPSGLAAVTDVELHEMRLLTDVLASVPSLFASVVHYDPNNSDYSLFIYDGAIVSASTYGGITAHVVTDEQYRIHISSSAGRLVTALQSSTVQAALGTVQQGPFGDRSVYVDVNQWAGSAATPLVSTSTAKVNEPLRANFW